VILLLVVQEQEGLDAARVAEQVATAKAFYGQNY